MKTLVLVSLFLIILSVSGSINVEWTSIYQAPPGRSGALFKALSNTQAVVAFGRGQSDREVKNDMWKYDLLKRRWEPWTVDGDNIPERSKQCGAVLNGTLYVYGGRNSNLREMSDMYALKYDTQNELAWRQVFSPYGDLWPPGLMECSTVVTHDGFMIVFGPITNRTFHFSTRTLKWSEKSYSRSDIVVRRSACCTNIPTNSTHAICHGGYDVNGFSDVATSVLVNLNTFELTVVKHPPGSPIPPARSFHSCYADEQNHFVIFSGYAIEIGTDLADQWRLNLKTMVWESVEVDPSVAPLDSSGIVRLSSALTFLWGGWGLANSALSALYTFNETTSKATVVYDDTQRPSARYGHVFVTVSSNAYLLFGTSSTDGKVFPPDVAWSYDFAKWQPLPQPNVINRYRCSAIVKGFQVYILFGLDLNQKYLDEVVRWIPLDGMSMTIMPKQGLWPDPRADTAIATTQDMNIVIFGGLSASLTYLNDLWMYESEMNQWFTIPFNQAQAPDGRLLACLGRSSSGFVLMQGQGSNTMSDRWALKLSYDDRATPVLANWTQLEPFQSSDVTEQRKGSACFYHPSLDAIIVVGGDVPGGRDLVYNVTAQRNDGFASPTSGFPIRQAGVAGFKSHFIQFGGIDPINQISGAITDLKPFPWYCSPGSVGRDNNCTVCPPGTYHDSIEMLECLQCPPGTFNALPGLVGTMSCVPCAQGSYQPDAGQPQCLPCATSQFCPVGSERPSSTAEVNDIAAQDVQPESRTTSGVSEASKWRIITTFIVLGSIAAILIFMLWSVNQFFSITGKENDSLHTLRRIYLVITNGSENITLPQLQVLLYIIRAEKDTPMPDVELLRTLFGYHCSISDDIDFHKTVVLLAYLNSMSKVIPYKIGFEKVGDEAEKSLRRYRWWWTLPQLDHLRTEVEAVGFTRVVRTTSAGGVLTIIAIFGVFAAIWILAADYFENNIIETRSTLPQILLSRNVVRANNPNAGVCKQMTVSTHFFGLPSTSPCDCSLYTVNTANIKFGTQEVSCTQTGNRCSVMVVLKEVTLAANPQLTVTATDSSFFASGIRGVVRTLSGGPTENEYSETSKAVSPKISGNVHRGRLVPTSFSVEVFPTTIDHFESIGTGYISNVEVLRSGDEVQSKYVTTVRGHVVQYVFSVQTQAGVLITRRQRISIIDFLSNIAAIPGAVIGCATIITLSNLILYHAFLKKRKPIRRTRKASLALNVENPEVTMKTFDVFKDQDYALLVLASHGVALDVSLVLCECFELRFGFRRGETKEMLSLEEMTLHQTTYFADAFRAANGITEQDQVQSPLKSSARAEFLAYRAMSGLNVNGSNKSLNNNMATSNSPEPLQKEGSQNSQVVVQDELNKNTNVEVMESGAMMPNEVNLSEPIAADLKKDRKNNSPYTEET
eukprot:PhF_6_TR7922/c1_g1_i1/m.11849